MYKAIILADSINTSGNRLTTFEITYPRFVHSELMTHRMFSRNSASSRAIPLTKMIDNVLNDPVLPVYWGRNQSGMQATTALSVDEQIDAEDRWLWARDAAVENAKRLNELHVHKQIANRILEPWMWITVIVSATEWANFFSLRCHPDAQPEIQKIAYMMRDLYYANTPEPIEVGECHLPLIDYETRLWAIEQTLADDRSAHESKADAQTMLKQIATGRCARVSYLTHDGKRDPQADIDLCDRLRSSGHWSPFEHVAYAISDPYQCANFKGWFQYRKEFAGENVRIYIP